MKSTGDTAAAELATRIRDARHELTQEWLERIAARANVDPARISPTDELLERVPKLMVGIADYIEDPAEEIASDLPVIVTATELGELRLGDGFDVSDILEEYELLGRVVFEFAADTAAELAHGCTSAEVFTFGQRIFRAISAISQITTSRYLRALGERVGEREERLRRFNRMITHELKNRVGATLGAGQLLQEEWLGEAERRRFAGMVTENAQAIQKVLENLIALSRIDRERRRQRNVPLREVVLEVFRQLHDLARARQVELRAADDLPEIEVNAAAAELCLSNYLSNAIKYSDPSASHRWAEVTAALGESVDRPGEREIVVRVRDNGIGVPPDARPHLFERFFRAHGDAHTEGTGLGLNLVQETVQALGGRAWAEFDEGTGSAFVFTLPSRREGETGDVSGVAAARMQSSSRRQGAAPATASD
ncbi:MAG TPA: HAMP domain-containing sensor histidine kinase [Longimicrobiales bacterium]